MKRTAMKIRMLAPRQKHDDKGWYVRTLRMPFGARYLCNMVTEGHLVALWFAVPLVSRPEAEESYDYTLIEVGDSEELPPLKYIFSYSSDVGQLHVYYQRVL